MKITKYLVIAIIAVTIYYASFLSHEIWIRADSASYLLLGRSIAAGKGYVDHYYPRPQIDSISPPGYPFLLSTAIRIFGDNLLLLRILTMAMVALSLVPLAGLLRQYLDGKDLIFAFLLFALNPLFVHLTNMLITDAPYMLFSLSAVFLLNKGGKLTYTKVLLAVLAIIAGYYIRTAGLFLYISLIIYLLMRKERKYLPVVILLGLSILPWVIHVLKYDSGYNTVFMMRNPYNLSLGTITVSDIFLRALANIKYYIGKVTADLIFFPCFKDITFGNLIFPVKVFLSSVFSLLFIAAFFNYVRRKGVGLAEIYVFIYCAVLIFWTYHDERFLIPIYPFFLIYLLIFFKKPRIMFAGKIVVFALFFGLIMGNVEEIRGVSGKESSGSFFETVEWIRAHTPPDAIIMSWDIAGMYLYSGRKGVPLRQRGGAAGAINTIEENDVRYIVMDKVGLTIAGKKQSNFDIYLRPILEKRPGCLNMAYESSLEPKILVYKVGWR